MELVAVVRPASWNWVLFLHIGGAMVTLASLVVALYAIRIARERGDQPATGFAFAVLSRATLPAYVVMRVFAQILESREHLDKHSPSWIGIGFGVSDFGLVALIVALVLTRVMLRRTRAGTSVQGAAGLRIAGALAAILVAAYVVAIWAMTTKPN